MTYQSPFHMRLRCLTNKKIQDDSKKRNHIQNLESKVLKQTTHQTTPNMMDAYKQVRQNDYEPSEGEIKYRQMTTSSYIKH